MNWRLSGAKSYLIGFAMIVVAGLHAQGYISGEVKDMLQGLLLGGGIMALRASISKAGNGK